MQRADKRRYHYIYRITRDDGMFYIGMHSTDDLDDGYFGSGKLLWYSVRKHGKEKHTKEIIQFLGSREELKLREKEIVNEELVKNSWCLNLKTGGEGDFSHINKLGRNIYGKNGKPGFGGENLNAGRTTSAGKNRWKNNREVMLLTARRAILLAAEASKSLDAIEKRKATYAERGHQQGEKNSQFGSCWVTDDVKPIKIRKERLDEYLAKGYQKGRKNK